MVPNAIGQSRRRPRMRTFVLADRRENGSRPAAPPVGRVTGSSVTMRVEDVGGAARSFESRPWPDPQRPGQVRDNR